MKKDEAIGWFTMLREKFTGTKYCEYLDMAIKALEQQPCEDCISRQAVIDIVDLEDEWLYDAKSHNTDTNTAFSTIKLKITALPSVTPELIKGRWIEDAKTYYEELNKRGLRVDEYTPYFTDDIACSECLAKYSVLDNETQFFKYCPNCGAKTEVDDAE